MSKFMILAASALTLLPLTAASAQDAAMSGDSLFNGAFVGGQLGYGHRTIDNAAIHDSRNGVDYGGYLGYDATLGSRLVLGAEGDIGAGGKTLRQNFAGVGSTSINPSWNWSVSGRAGFLASPNMLFYGRVGYGEERVRTRFNSALAAVPSASNRSWTDGVIYGGGVEYAFTPRISARAEYRYSNFDGSYNPQQALVGVSFRF